MCDSVTVSAVSRVLQAGPRGHVDGTHRKIGGRPDIADRFLRHVAAPTLLIVGGDDHEVLALNRRAMSRMTCETELAVIPHASHLFEEAGALDQVTGHALRWFQRHFQQPDLSEGGRRV